MPDLSLEDRLRNFLGSGYQRFDELRQKGDGRPMSDASISNFDALAEEVARIPHKLYLFLTPEGHLQLEWLDARGGQCEIEFLPDAFEFYFESLAHEGSLPIGELPELVGIVHGLEKETPNA